MAGNGHLWGMAGRGDAQGARREIVTVMGTARDRFMLTASVGLSAAGDTLAIAPLATILALDSIPALLFLAALIGTGNAVAQAAEFSLSPVAAGPDGLARLNGWIESSRYLGMTIGPALGGLLAAVGHPLIALAGNALTFLAVAAIALSLTVRRHPAATGHGSGGGEQTGEAVGARSGFALLCRERPELRTTILIAMVSLVAMTTVWPAEPFFATDVLGGSEATYGLLMSTWTLGMAIGSIGLAHVRPERSPSPR